MYYNDCQLLFIVVSKRYVKKKQLAKYPIYILRYLMNFLSSKYNIAYYPQIKRVKTLAQGYIFIYYIKNILSLKENAIYNIEI